MAKLSILAGTTSKTVKVFVQNNSVTTGAGLTGLAYNTSGLTAYYIREGGSADVAISLATATLGTWASGGFIVVDATNMPGVYELGLPNAALASGAKSCLVYLQGAANMAPVVLEIELTAVDNQNATTGGMGALPNAAAGASGGLWILGANTGTVTLTATAGNNVALTIAGTGTASGVIISSNSATGPALQIIAGGAAAGLYIANASTGPAVEFVGGQGSSALLLQGCQTGTGIGKALVINGGTTSGDAVDISATSGRGINIAAGGGYDGVDITAGGTGSVHALALTGNAGGVGLNAVGGITGNGANFTAGGTSGAGLTISSPSGVGATIIGGGANPGLLVESGTGATGDAAVFTALSTNGNAFNLTGSGTGNGALITSGAGATGDALHLVANSSNGNGFYAKGVGTGDGMDAVAGSGGSMVSWPTSGGTTVSSVISSGTAQGGTSTTIQLAAGEPATAAYVGCDITTTGGTGKDQTALCTAWNTSTKTATVTPAWSVTPDSTTTYQVTAAAVMVAGYASGQDPATLVLDVAASGHNTSGTVGAKINAAGAYADPWAVALPGAYTSGEAGYIVGTNLNATISSRSTLTQAQVTGGAWTLQTDGSGYMLLSNGTGAGQVSLASGVVSANAVQIAGQSTSAPGSGGVTFPSSVAANNEIRSATAQGGGSSTITLDSGASATNSFYNGENIEIVSGTGAGQTRQITGYVGSTKVATVGTPWVVNPDSTSAFKILSSAAGGSVNVGSITSGAITSSAFASGAVTAGSLFQVDGLAIDSALIAMLATLLGETTVSGNTVDFKKQDGSTTKVAITYGSTAGQRTGSTVS